MLHKFENLGYSREELRKASRPASPMAAISAFYPEGIAAQEMPAFYGGRFHTVELNNSFYKLPKVETLDRWREDSPPGFIFSVKASRYITHVKKLRDPHATLPVLLERVEVLDEKLGPFLFQLPPKWKFNEDRFEVFVATLFEGIGKR